MNKQNTTKGHRYRQQIGGYQSGGSIESEMGKGVQIYGDRWK